MRQNRKWAVALSLGCWALASGAADTLSESQAARETEFDGLRLLDSQEYRLGALGLHLGYVDADTKPGDGMYLCGAMSRDDALAAASEVTAALAYLPDAPLAKLRLRYVVLCGRTLAGGRPIGGIPVPPLNLLMLDASAARRDAAYFRHQVLHEVYHLAEYRYGRINDPGWSAQFGAGYANAYPTSLPRSAVGGGKPGFINAYGQSFPSEERAELFAFLVMNPQEVAALIRQTDDRVLKAKAGYVADTCQQTLGLSLASP